MKNVFALVAFGLLMSSPAMAQTPAPTAQTPAPAVASSAPCASADKTQMRACNLQKIKDARKSLDQAITEACRKQVAKGGDVVGCRADLMIKTAQSIH
jgi:hypothetical protein